MNVPSPIMGRNLPQAAAGQASPRRYRRGAPSTAPGRCSSGATLAVLQRDRHVLADRVVVQEVALDLVALVAEREHELVEAVARVVLHDVPQDRPAADLDERFRTHLGLLGQARAGAAAQDDDGNPFGQPREIPPGTSQPSRRRLVSSVKAGAQPSTSPRLAGVEILIADFVRRLVADVRLERPNPSPRAVVRPARAR